MIIYSAGWSAAIYVAGKGYLFWASSILLLAIVLQFVYTYIYEKHLFYRDLISVCATCILGYLVDMVMTKGGFIAYAHTASGSQPMWILFLYALFALTLNHSFKKIAKHPLWGFPLGVIGGNFAYRSGHYFHAVTFLKPMGITILAIGIEWGLLLPTLFLINLKLSPYLLSLYRRKVLASQKGNAQTQDRNTSHPDR